MNINQKIVDQSKGPPPQKEPPYSLFVINSLGIVESWSEQCETNLGYKQLSIVGKHCSLFLQKKEVEKLIKQAISFGSTTKTVQFKKPDESWIQVIILLNSIYDKHQQVMGFLVTIKNMGHVSKQITSPSIPKQNGSANSAQPLNESKELEYLKKKIELVAHSISHDLRAPLRAIDAYLKMIDEDYAEKLEPEINDFINHARLNVKKMNALIENLLTLSRMSIREINLSSIDMNMLVKEVLEDLKKEFKYEYDIRTTPLHPINADYSLISIVLHQLLSNALKFSSQNNTPTIEISSEKKGDKVIYKVRDNGIGIDKSKAGKLFVEFTKLHNITGIDGTGMGLVIVKQAIDKHGGNVGFDSNSDKGTIFYFSIPV